MASGIYSGSITTIGTSEGFRIEKPFFRHHPEFAQKARIEAKVIGPGVLLVSLAEPAMDRTDVEEDPVLAAFLAFLDNDIREHPERVQPVPADLMSRVDALGNGDDVSDDEVFPEGLLDENETSP